MKSFFFCGHIIAEFLTLNFIWQMYLITSLIIMKIIIIMNNVSQHQQNPSRVPGPALSALDSRVLWFTPQTRASPIRIPVMTERRVWGLRALRLKLGFEQAVKPSPGAHEPLLTVFWSTWNCVCKTTVEAMRIFLSGFTIQPSQFTLKNKQA